MIITANIYYMCATYGHVIAIWCMESSYQPYERGTIIIPDNKTDALRD